MLEFNVIYAKHVEKPGDKARHFQSDWLYFYRKEWLSSIGSPKSRIDRCEFKREKTIDRPEYSSFNIRK